jgi:hypothetical protein
MRGFLKLFIHSRQDLPHNAGVIVINKEASPIGFGANDPASLANNARHLLYDPFGVFEMLQGAIHPGSIELAIPEAVKTGIRENIISICDAEV